MNKIYKIIFLSFTLLIMIILNFSLLITYQNHKQRQIRQNKILSDLQLTNKNITYSSSKPPLVLGIIEPEINTNDARLINLQRYLAKYDSPLYNYADKIIYYSDLNNLDYRILVAIAGQESTFCKKIPYNSHNCWGWGIYGDQVIMFDNYDQAIKTVAEGLKKNYVDRGLVTSEEIMKKYTPSSTSWASAIRYFFNKIEQP